MVLVRPTHPGNIGATARAMRNMGLSRLMLVEPQDFPSDTAAARAAGADDVLTSAEGFANVADAVAGCKLVVATTARPRSIGWPVETPKAVMPEVAKVSDEGEVAMLFGQERAGLSNAEVDHAQRLIRIPVNDDFSSLNLAAAVLLVAYELSMAGGDIPATHPEEESPEEEYPSAEESHFFYEHLEKVLRAIGFLKPTASTRLMRKLVWLFTRARPSIEEINILRGILTAVERIDRKNNNKNKAQ
ncbi:MAG: tRNA (cytosine(32)/uridine(32)-2'-O)-methyltransferase TrmJ [Acidiferrobacteraceae bacterium]|nr:tRNA (cytosine(32)/uridine(32)-2'-O)-methyltransferase TrmJ [Acidiferrobacteraceae bacterium]